MNNIESFLSIIVMGLLIFVGYQKFTEERRISLMVEGCMVKTYIEHREPRSYIGLPECRKGSKTNK